MDLSQSGSPREKESPNLGMLEIKVEKGEHWDCDTSKMVKTLKMAKAKLKKEQPDIGEHETFGTKKIKRESNVTTGLWRRCFELLNKYATDQAFSARA